MKWLLGFGLLSVGLLPRAWGQAAPGQPAPPPAAAAPRWALSVDLVPLIASGYHLSAERKLGASSRQTLVLTPQLYRGPVADLTSDLHHNNTDRVRGGGLAAQHRFYLGANPTPLAGTYLAYSLLYQHFDLRFEAAGWQSELANDGLYYYQYGVRDQRETINRYGASVLLGHQIAAPGTPFFLDVFLGLGLRQATSRGTLPEPQFAATSSDYGQAGVYVPLGFRLSLHL